MQDDRGAFAKPHSGGVGPLLVRRAGGIPSPGTAASGIGSLSIDGDLDLFGNLDIGINGAGAGAFDTVAVSGQTACDNTSFLDFSFGSGWTLQAGDQFLFLDPTTFDFAGASSNFSRDGLAFDLTRALSQPDGGMYLTLDGVPDGGGSSGDGGVTVVPEPGDLAMLGAGLGLAGGWLLLDRRRRHGSGEV